MIYWLIRRKRTFLLSAVILVAAWFFFNPFIEFSSEKSSDEFENSLKILSYNVRLFNAYEDDSKVNVSEIISEILEEQQPDIVCIQEYYNGANQTFSEYPYQFVHFKKTTNNKGVTKKHVLGHAILSKYPLINTGAFDFDKTYNNSIYADVLKGDDTIRVYNLHLKSMGITPSVATLQDGDKEKLRKRMSNAFLGQQQQMEAVMEHKAKSKFPVLLCGDFNNTSFSYIYRKIQKGMKDGFVEKGNSLGTTYLFDYYPMRIDYIFTSESFEVLSFETSKRTFSDHYPISAKVGW